MTVNVHRVMVHPEVYHAQAHAFTLPDNHRRSAGLPTIAAQRNRLFDESTVFRSFTRRAKSEFIDEVARDRIREQTCLALPAFGGTDSGFGLCECRIALERHCFQIFQLHRWPARQHIASRLFLGQGSGTSAHKDTTHR
jgi:hypothetical protein